MTLIHSFDLDSTLIDTSSVQHMINLEDRALTDWIGYAHACADIDLPDGPAAPVLNALIEAQAREIGPYGSRRGLSVDFIVVSRRDTAAREATLQQLAKRGWVPSELIMLGDQYSDPTIRGQAEWKVAAIRAYEARAGNWVVCHYDDNHAVTVECMRQGIPAVTVRGESEGEYAIGQVGGV